MADISDNNVEIITDNNVKITRANNVQLTTDNNVKITTDSNVEMTTDNLFAPKLEFDNLTIVIQSHLQAAMPGLAIFRLISSWYFGKTIVFSLHLQLKAELHLKVSVEKFSGLTSQGR
ncbi:hypothetical protein HUJ05_010185 [Dendroctonus ponderosae]|nr:hypothetical protein HUJ05_010185 [Dendroctonus ponderosae]